MPRKEQPKATADRFAVVTDEELERGLKTLVHVEGWAAGACFRYLRRTATHYKLETPKTGKQYNVPLTKRLLHTRGH